MKISKIDSGFAIEFPFALKENFKKTFPSSKWNPVKKMWEVGPRSGKRLETWVAEASAAANAIEELDKQEMTASELEDLRRELSAIERKTLDTIEQCDSAIENKASIARVADEIASANDRLDAARDKLKAAKSAVKTEKQRVDDLLGSIIDLAEIHRNADIMYRNMIPSNKRAKEKFEDARSVIYDQRELLLDAGWRCRAIEKLATANVNRPDRDHPRHVLESDWYDVFAAEREDD